MENTALNIKKYRDKSHMTQAELSEKSGVSRSLINQLETGKRPFANSKTLQRLAVALGCNISDFFVKE